MSASPDPALAQLQVPVEALRWSCPPEAYSFKTTAEVDPVTGIVGQPDAVASLRFGLEIEAPGQNVFVRGLAGTGRMTLVRRQLEELAPSCRSSDDLCYVHDFGSPDQPRLVRLPAGRGPVFQDRIDELAHYITDKLGPELSSEELSQRKAELEKQLSIDMAELGAPFDRALRADGLMMVQANLAGETKPMVVPSVDGKPVTPDEIQAQREDGTLDQDQFEALQERIAVHSQRFEEVSLKVMERREEHAAAMRALYEDAARDALAAQVREIAAQFPTAAVSEFLDEVLEDVVVRHLGRLAEDSGAITRRYRVNVVLTRKRSSCPIVIETSPSVKSLLGTIERKLLEGGHVHSDHLMIHPGSLLRANGGFLILEAREVLGEPGAWKALMRTLRTGSVEITPENFLFGPGSSLKPEPIEIDVKVILIGDPGLYYALDAGDPDFPHLFKVLADFESSIERDDALDAYAGVLARLVHDEEMLHFRSCAVAALAEHGARIAARSDRLTSRFGRLADIAREAVFVAGKAGRELVEAEDVKLAVQSSKRRGDLPARKFRELIRSGTIRIQTDGAVVGQINGLAVVSSGPLSYGFPSRITSTIGAGSRGAINIERESQLSGAIHTKGFYILGGLLRHLLPTAHPLAFSASIAFEQSYGGIDGDSASGAEVCCLLSALTGVPIRQEFAMTGAIDQHGHIQAIGAANEKIEGFFDACTDGGLTGEQGVIIPGANRGDLMLREDVVEACRAGRFHVYAVDRIQDALEILTGIPVGELDEDGLYPEESLLGLAMDQAAEYWLMATGRPTGSEEEDDEEEQASGA